MVLSVFGVMIGGISSGEKPIEYNDVVFNPTNEGYSFSSNGFSYLIVNSPLEIEGFFTDFSNELWSDVYARRFSKIYLDISNQNTIAAANEIYQNLKGKEDVFVSCSEDHKEDVHCLDLPIKSCIGEEGVLIINFEVTEEKENSYESGCLNLRGSLGYLIGASDVFILKYAGVF